MACCRKSGVVSMTTFWPSRERRIDGRRRLSCGSFEWQTRHGQPKVGTPIEVPEPRTVIFNGALGMVKRADWSYAAETGRLAPQWCRVPFVRKIHLTGFAPTG